MVTRIEVKKVDQEQMATFEYKVSKYDAAGLEKLRKWYDQEPVGMNAYDRQCWFDKREYLRVEIARRENKRRK